jgi:hypothetical protein
MNTNLRGGARTTGRKLHRKQELTPEGGMSHREIAEVLGITRGGAWMAERAIIRKLWRRKNGVAMTSARERRGQ